MSMPLQLVEMYGRMPYTCLDGSHGEPAPRTRAQYGTGWNSASRHPFASSSSGQQRCPASPQATSHTMQLDASLKSTTRMMLRGEDRDAFLKAVANPLPPARRLVAALRRHTFEIS